MSNALNIAGILAKHFPESAISAILGNIDVETGGTFDHTQQQDNGPGYGLFQFDSQKPFYFRYLENKGMEDSPESQIKFVADAIYNNRYNAEGLFTGALDIGGKSRDAIIEAFKNGSTAEITRVFSDEYEKPSTPHMEKRVEAAEEFDRLKGLLSGNVIYEDEQSRSDWSSLAPDITDWLYEQGAGSVYPEHLFPNKAGLLSTSGLDTAEAEAKYAKYGLDAGMQGDMGHEQYKPDWVFDDRMVREAMGLSDKKARTVLSVTDTGQESSSTEGTLYKDLKAKKGAPKVEEYLHYLDDVMGDTSTGLMSSEKQQPLSKIMTSYMNDSWKKGGSNKGELLEAWMNDPDTAHLEIEDAKDWSHHGNMINPRLELGNFLVASLTDTNYKNWSEQQGSQSDYFLSPKETFANAARPLVKYSEEDEFRKVEQGGGFKDFRIGGLDR